MTDYEVDKETGERRKIKSNDVPSLPLTHRTAAEMSDMAARRIDHALRAVQSVLDDPDANNSDKIAAAAFIRDTAHGKPAQIVTVRKPNTKVLDGLWERVEAAGLVKDVSISGIEPVNETKLIDN